MTVLRDWLKVRGEPKATALFLNARGDMMTRSGFEYILEKHVRTAGTKQASLASFCRETRKLLMCQQL